MDKRVFRIEQSPLERARLWVEIIAFAVAGCWGFYTFVYQTKIAPAGLPAHETFAVSVQRLARSQERALERVQMTVRNDGAVDVDTAGVAINVYGAPRSRLGWKTLASKTSFQLHSLKPRSLVLLQSVAYLFDGASEGRRRSHLLLRPGDTADFPILATVPREDDILVVEIDTVYARYPILHRIPIRLQRTPRGGIDLSANHSGDLSGMVNLTYYFSV